MKTFFRTIGKNKTSLFTAVLGLAVGLIGMLIALLEVDAIVSREQYLDGSERIFQVYFQQQTRGGSMMTLDGFDVATVQSLERAAGLESVAGAAQPFTASVASGEGESIFVETTAVSERYFATIPFPVSAGQIPAAFTSGAVLSAGTARSLFGNEAAVGKTVTIRLPDGRALQEQVISVLDEYPKSAHLRPELLLPLATALPQERYVRIYVRTADAADREAVRDRISQVELEHGFAWLSDRPISPEPMKLRLEPFGIPVLTSRGAFFSHPQLRYVALLGAIALGVFALSVVNVTGVLLAFYDERRREMAIRRAAGALTRDLARQLFGESVVIAAAAVTIGLALLELSLPWYNAGVGSNLSLGDVPLEWAAIAAPLLVLFVAVVAGSSPIAIVSRRELAGFLQRGKRATLLRQILLAVELAAAVALVLIAGTLRLESSQLRETPVGFRTDATFSINGQSVALFDERKAELVDRLRGEPGITQAAYGSWGGWETRRASSYPVTGQTGAQAGQFIHVVWAQPEWREVLGIELVAGDVPLRDDGSQVLISERMSRLLGLGVGDLTPRGARISGVVADFAYDYVGEPLVPVIIGNAEAERSPISNSPIPTDIVVVSYVGSDQGELEGQILPIWRELFPGTPLPLMSISEEVERVHDRATGRDEWITLAGSILAASLAAVGVFSLASFEIRRRRQGLAVRAAFGATPLQNSLALLASLAPAVAAGIVIAIPIAIVGVDTYYESLGWTTIVPVSWGSIAIASIAGVAVTVLAAATHLVAASRLRPAEILSEE